MSPCDLSYSSSLWWSLSNSLQVKIIANMTRLEEIPAYKLAKVPPKTTISSKNKMTITIIDTCNIITFRSWNLLIDSVLRKELLSKIACWINNL